MSGSPLKSAIPLLAGSLGALLLLSACGGSDASSAAGATPKKGGTLVYATGDDEPTCLDPQSRGNVPQALLGTQFLQSLFYQDDKGEIEPWLATKWKEAADHLSWTVDLRSDVKFSDGTAFDAAAVKTNIERVLDPATGSTTGALALGKVKSVDVLGTDQVRINLDQPDSALLESLSQVWIPMESPTALKRTVAENCESPVGTGAFKVQSWTKQDNVTLVRNDLYTTPPPGATNTGTAYLDKIEWRFVPDSSTRFAALQSGQVDVIDTLQPQDAVAAKSSGNLKTLIASRPGEPVEIKLNTGRAPFDDDTVREAFLDSIDVASALKSVYLGTVEPAKSLLSSTTRYTVDTIGNLYDPTKAGQLLDQAGWSTKDSDGYRTKDGKRLTVVLPYSAAIPLAEGFYDQLQSTAKAVGFDVQVEKLDTAKWWTENYNWNYDAIPIYYTKNSADVFRITSTTAAINEANPGAYHANNIKVKSKTLDSLINQAGEVSDDTQRADLYQKVQQFLTDGHYVLPIYDQQTRLGYSDQVQGLKLLPSLSMPTFADAWVNR